ncbi:MAG: helix-turn-helix domain-containing protein [Aestuariivirga sp.]|uniref:helix-turn-helix domain-containing protein n=1 Tax=Aestuariivirga sp. TaxID=2650926 RepID=UPI0038CF3AAB
MRARIVLTSARGAQSKNIAVELGVCASTMGKCRRRFAAPGLDGLYDEPRSGKPAALMARALKR